MSHPWHYHTVLVATLLALNACATSRLNTCRPGQQPAILDTLYFGSAKPVGAVTPTEWRQFLNRVVTPQFPQGLTWWPAFGQWQTATGQPVAEAAYVLQLAHPDTADNEQALGAVLREYKREFQQQSVLRVRTMACMAY